MHYIYEHISGKRSTPIPAHDARRCFFERNGWTVVEVVNDDPAAVVEAAPLGEQGESDETGTVCGDCGDPDCDGGDCGERGAALDG